MSRFRLTLILILVVLAVVLILAFQALEPYANITRPLLR